MKLSVLIPVYNEKNTLIPVINLTKNVPLDKEIIIVDDYSTDGTREIIKENFNNDPEIKIIYHKKNLGKGVAIKSALRQAKGEFSIIQDGDLEYDPNDYIKLIDAANKSDIVYGSRFLKTWRVTSIWHFLINKILTSFTNLLYFSNLTDMETCYKLIKTNIFQDLNLESSRFEIEAEITAKLLKKNRITEIPISYRGRTYHEGKKITWKDGFTTIWTLIKYRFVK